MGQTAYLLWLGENTPWKNDLGGVKPTQGGVNLGNHELEQRRSRSVEGENGHSTSSPWSRSSRVVT